MNKPLSGKGGSPNARMKGSRGRRIGLIEPFSIDEPRYLLGQVAFAAGISANLLKAWIDRKIIRLGEHDRGAHGKGSSRVFTLRRALVVATTAELVNTGMAASGAGHEGEMFVRGALREAGADPLRVDGLFALYSETEPEPAISVLAFKPTSTLAKVLKPRKHEPTHTSFVLVSMKAVNERVLKRLGELA